MKFKQQVLIETLKIWVLKLTGLHVIFFHAGSQQQLLQKENSVYAWKGMKEEFNWCIEQTIFLEKDKSL